jgi:NodT family efflux transporter outer membrane factor (OMF) lipoprotein
MQNKRIHTESRKDNCYKGRFDLRRNKGDLKRFRFLALGAGVVLIMSGCTMIGPDFIRPEAPIEKEWIETGDARVKTEKTDYSQWWTVFNDTVLNTLIDKAYQQNLTLQIAGIRILEARAQLGIAVGNLYPQQQVGFAGISRNEVSDNTSTSLGADSPFNSLDLGFDAVWELDIWGKFRRAVESGVANLEASIAGYDDFLVSLTAEVARTYVLIRTLEQRLDIARQNVKIQARSLQIARVRYEAGDVSELDVTQARSLLRNTQALIPRLESGLRQSKNGLAILLGVLPSEIGEMLGPPGTIPEVSSEVFVDIPAELLRRRPDIRLAELQLATQSARIGIAKADLYPHFTLFGSVGLATSSGTATKAGGTDGSDLGDLFESDSLTWSTGAGLSWDIFNYGRIKNRVRVEDARFQQLVVNYEDTVLRAFQEIEDAMVAFLRAQEEEKFLLDSVKASQRSVDLSLLQYREGLTDYQRVLDTQRFLTDQSDVLTATSGDVVLNLVALYKALGGGWQTRVGEAYVSPANRELMRKRTDWGKLLEPEKLQPPASPEERNDWRRPDW